MRASASAWPGSGVACRSRSSPPRRALIAIRSTRSSSGSPASRWGLTSRCCGRSASTRRCTAWRTPTPTPMARRSRPRAGPHVCASRGARRTNMTSERQAYIHVQLPGTLERVPAALLKVEALRDGTFVGRFRYGERYIQRQDAVEFDPFQLPLGHSVHEFTRLKGIPGAVRDAGPDAWGRRVIEHKLQRGPADLEEIDYLLHGPQDGAGCLSFGTTAR